MPLETGGPPVRVHMSVVAFGAIHASRPLYTLSASSPTATPVVFVMPLGSPTVVAVLSSMPRPMYGDAGNVMSLTRYRPQSSMSVPPFASGGVMFGALPNASASYGVILSAHGPVVSEPEHSAPVGMWSIAWNFELSVMP